MMENKKKINRRTIIAIILGVSIVIDIVLAAIFIPKLLKKKNYQIDVRFLTISRVLLTDMIIT